MELILAIVGIALGVGAWVFAVWRDRMNVESFGRLAELIENVIGSLVDGDDGR